MSRNAITSEHFSPDDVLAGAVEEHCDLSAAPEAVDEVSPGLPDVHDATGQSAIQQPPHASCQGADAAEAGASPGASGNIAASMMALADGANGSMLTSGELAEIMSTFNNVTSQLHMAHVGLQNEVARLQSELRQTNEQLRRSRELAALGQMAAGIAHEIRNPLGCIRLYSALLRDDLEELPESKSIVERIDRAALDMDAIVGDVLAFAREIKVKPTPVPAATVVAQALEGCAALIKQSNIDIDTEATENELAEVELLVDPALINQVVTNLIRNAIEAMDGKGRLEIQLGCALRARDESPPIRVESHQWNAARSDGMAASLKTAKDAAADDEASMVSCPIDRELPKRAPMGRANERFISLSIIDSGPGIEPEVLERVFNPFFTTRAHGTGLGLAIAHRIADAHHAVIELSNRPQQGGLDATLHLPIADPGIMLRVAPGSDATETKSLPGSSSKRNSKASLDAGTPVRRRATKKSTPRRTASSRAGKKSAGMSAVDATGI